jgi:hypothetical protein
MSGAIPPLPQYVFLAWCLVKYMDNFTLPYVTLLYLILLKDTVAATKVMRDK